MRQERQSSVGWALALMMTGGAAMLSGCGSGEGTGESELFRTDPASTADSDPSFPAARGPNENDAILPARVRVHPLTRLMSGPATPGDAIGSDEYQLACHIELRDRFGHVVKGLGQLRVELYRPATGGGSGGPENQDTVWNIDLRDPIENARVYDDLVTRTYTVYLTSLPEWLQEWARQGAATKATPASPAKEGEKSQSASGWVTLKAFFVVNDSRGREKVLQTSFRLER